MPNELSKYAHASKVTEFTEKNRKRLWTSKHLY